MSLIKKIIDHNILLAGHAGHWYDGNTQCVALNLLVGIQTHICGVLYWQTTIGEVFQII